MTSTCCDARVLENNNVTIGRRDFVCQSCYKVCEVKEGEEV
jgi:hypothetical protein